MHRLVSVVLAAAVLAGAQGRRAPKPAPAPAKQVSPETRFPIASLSVAGNKLYKPAQILKATGLKPGDEAGRNEFDAARQRLLDTGYFETVGYSFGPSKSKPGHYDATFEVTEIAQVYPWRVEGVPLPPADIRGNLAQLETIIADRIPGNQHVLARYAAHIEGMVQAAGKGPMKIAGRVVAADDGLAVEFRPLDLPAVAEVYFEGNRLFDQQTLQRAVAGAAVGSIFTERRFQEILDNSVRPVYEEAGRLNVKWTKLATGPAKNARGIAVTVTLEEGPAYGLRSVKVVGIPNGAQLLKAAKLDTQGPANMKRVNDAADEIVRTLRRDGYLTASAMAEKALKEPEHLADVTIRVTPGSQYKMGKLTIAGLDIITEPHIRKMWALKPGQPFNGEYPDQFLKRLREDGIFENLGDTASRVDTDAANLVADVELRFGAGVDLPQIGPNAEIDKKKKQPY